MYYLDYNFSFYFCRARLC